MMFCVYRISDGEAVSFGSVVADPLPDGLAAIDVGDITGKRWDPQTLAMVDLPPEPVVKTAAEIAAEYATIETIADMEAFRQALEGSV